MLSTAAQSDLRNTLKSKLLLSYPSHKSHDLQHSFQKSLKTESSPDTHLLLTAAVRRTTLSTKETRNILTLPSNSESGAGTYTHSFKLPPEFQTPRDPDLPSIDSNTSTDKKPFSPLNNPVCCRLKELKKQGYVWWGSFGADVLTHDIPFDVRCVSLRSELICVRGYALEFKPLKSNTLLPVLIRRKEKTAILRADLVPGEALKTHFKISLSSYAKSLMRIKCDEDEGERAYDAIIRATHLEGIALYFPTSSLYAKLSLHIANR